LLGEPEWGPAHRSLNSMALPKEHPRALQYAATAAVVLAHFQIYGAVLATIPVPETPGTPGTKSGVWNWYCNCRGDSCESGDGCDCCT
jgi:hypothetical protein